MDYEPKSIADQIDCLARLTGAPESFVDQVRELFTRKGISLEEDSAPYVKALEEAFIREESIRAGAQQTRAKLVRDATDFKKIGKAYAQQMERLRRVQAGLRDKRKGARKTSKTTSTTVPIDPQISSRSLVTRQQREDMPMVPGPEEIQ
jgi:hypothetical protein